MFFRLLALFTIVPLIELALLIPLGMQIGLWPTIALVVGTALLGAFLGKLEGARAWANIKKDLNQGKMPGDSLLDGLAVLIAGIFLVTPGVLTDVVAIILLIPPARKPIRAMARKRFKKMLDSGDVSVFTPGSMSGFSGGAKSSGESERARPFQTSPFSSDDGDVIDVTQPDDEPEESTQRETSTSEHISS